jgi:hypothetical protein
MSHFTTIQTQIRDLDALRDACGELGLGFTANAKCCGYAGVTRLTPHGGNLRRASLFLEEQGQTDSHQ